METSIEVILEIGRLYPNWKKTTLTQFFDEVKKCIGTTSVESTKGCPRKSEKSFVDGGAWKRMTLPEYREFCLDVYEVANYGVPSLTTGYVNREAAEHLRLMEEEQLMLSRQLAEVKKLNAQREEARRHQAARRREAQRHEQAHQEREAQRHKEAQSYAEAHKHREADVRRHELSYIRECHAEVVDDKGDYLQTFSPFHERSSVQPAITIPADGIPIEGATALPAR